jgi:hypothetical protein
MAAIDFPDSPTLNQEFTAGSLIYVWNGTTWNIKSSNQPPSSSIVSYSAEAPVSPVTGQVWVESDVNVNTIDTTTIYSKTEVDNALALKAPLASPSFTGTVDFTGSTVTGIDLLPSQSGNSGKYLTTNGTNASWGTIDLSTYATIAYVDSVAPNELDGGEPLDTGLVTYDGGTP